MGGSKKHQSIRLDQDLIDEIKRLDPRLSGVNNSALVDIALRSMLLNLQNDQGDSSSVVTIATTTDDDSNDDLGIGL